MNLIMELMGVVGLIALLISLIINVGKRTRQNIFRFYSLQLFGASLLCLYALMNHVYVFFILQGVFVLVSFYFIYEILIKSKKIKKN